MKQKSLNRRLCVLDHRPSQEQQLRQAARLENRGLAVFKSIPRDQVARLIKPQSGGRVKPGAVSAPGSIINKNEVQPQPGRPRERRHAIEVERIEQRFGRTIFSDLFDNRLTSSRGVKISCAESPIFNRIIGSWAKAALGFIRADSRDSRVHLNCPNGCTVLAASICSNRKQSGGRNGEMPANHAKKRESEQENEGTWPQMHTD